jgi:glycosyltransferase involved in cell wall biosynthesis
VPPAADRASAAAVQRGPAGPRRIALVIYCLGPGGAERVAARITGAWAAEGREVTLFTVASPEASGADADVYEVAAGVRRVPLDLNADSRCAVDAAVRSALRVRALRRAIAAARPDVVVSFMPQVNVLTLLATAGTGVPVVACERTDPRHARHGREWVALRRLLYPRARAVAVQTEQVAGWARRFCPRVHVIPNFVDPPARVAGALDTPGPKRLFAVGRLFREKGYDLLLDAFARCAPARPDWSLTILGEGPERRRLEAQVQALGLSGRVAMPGRVHDPAALLAGGQAFALPSRHEGFPNALLEAMACGLPVVAFDCQSGPSEAIVHGHDGLLVPAGDVAALAAALCRVMDSPEDRLRLGRNARAIVNRLGPANVLPQWTQLLRDACAPT